MSAHRFGRGPPRFRPGSARRCRSRRGSTPVTDQNSTSHPRCGPPRYPPLGLTRTRKTRITLGASADRVRPQQVRASAAPCVAAAPRRRMSSPFARSSAVIAAWRCEEGTTTTRRRSAWASRTKYVTSCGVQGDSRRSRARPPSRRWSGTESTARREVGVPADGHDRAAGVACRQDRSRRCRYVRVRPSAAARSRRGRPAGSGATSTAGRAHAPSGARLYGTVRARPTITPFLFPNGRSVYGRAGAAASSQL